MGVIVYHRRQCGELLQIEARGRRRAAMAACAVRDQEGTDGVRKLLFEIGFRRRRIDPGHSDQHEEEQRCRQIRAPWHQDSPPSVSLIVTAFLF